MIVSSNPGTGIWIHRFDGMWHEAMIWTISKDIILVASAAYLCSATLWPTLGKIGLLLIPTSGRTRVAFGLTSLALGRRT